MNETYQFRLFFIHSALFIRLALLEKEKENVNYILKSKTEKTIILSNWKELKKLMDAHDIYSNKV